MKKILSAILAAVMLCTAFSGCNNANTDNGADESLKKVKDKGEFVLGLDASFPPMGFKDENDEIVGFDIDIAKVVAERMGVTLRPQPIEWNSNVMELNSGNIDCVWNGMSINETRKEQMNLTEPYLRNKMVLVVLSDSDYTCQADLAGKIIAVQNGSTAQDLLEESEFRGTVKEVVGYDDNVTAFMDLEGKGVDAVFLDSIVADYFITSQEKPFTVLPDGLYEEEYAIGFRKADQALRDEVQRILSEMKADGTLGEISAKWFGNDITIVEPIAE